MMHKASLSIVRLLLLVALLAPGSRVPPGNNPSPPPVETHEDADLQPASCIPDSLVILSAHTPEEFNRGIALLEASCGCAVHSLPPDTVIGKLTRTAETALKQEGLLRLVVRQRASVADLAAISPTAGQGASLWNDVILNPQPEPPTAFPGPGGPPPLIDDHRRVAPAPAGQPDVQPGQPTSPGYYDMSSFLNGKIAVGLFLLESNGLLDPQTESWNSDRRTKASNEVKAAMSWYAYTFPKANLSFVYDEKLIQTRYEPINRSSRDDSLWIGEALEGMGYSQAIWLDKVYAYLNDLRSTYKTDWAELIIVVDSDHDSDGKFADGYFSYSYGFLIVETYDNASWGIGNMSSITAHEMAHNFGAADEYCAAGYACCWGDGENGYLGIVNRNCEAGCDKNYNTICDGDDNDPGSSCHSCTACAQVDCLMRNGTTSTGMDIPSRQQIGLRDTDNDGLYDPVDTFLAFDLAVPLYTNQTSPAYTGMVTDQPYDSPVEMVNDVSINYITAVQIRRDGESWATCTPQDGRFDSTQESFTCPLSGLSPGQHTVNLRAFNRSGNVSLWSQNVVVDASLPGLPTNLTSPSHVLRRWSSDTTIAATWSAAGDTGSSIGGYSVEWSLSPTSLPDTTIDTTTTAITSPPLATGQSWYVHVRSVDAAGNWSADAGHAGPYFIDATPPSLPSSADPGCAALDNTWQSTCADPSFTWDAATDGESGLAGYYYYFGPDSDGTSASFTANPAYDPPLLPGESSYYLRLQTTDHAGGASPWTTLFTLRYDATPPLPPEPVTSWTHSLKEWSSNPSVSVSWQPAPDAAGNTPQGFSVEWSTQPDTLPDTVLDVYGTEATSPPLADGTDWYVHIREMDSAALWGQLAAHYGPFYIDTQAPQADLISIKAPVCQRSLHLAWTGSDPASSASPGTASGVAGYDVQYQRVGDTAWKDWLSQTSLPSAIFGPANPVETQAGEFYRFRIRAYDWAGNTGLYTPAITASESISGCDRYLPLIVR